MKNSLNKEELLLRNRLNEASFDFKEADWAALEQQLPNKSFWSKYGTALKGAAALVFITAVVYVLNEQNTTLEENPIPNKELVEKKNETLTELSNTLELSPQKAAKELNENPKIEKEKELISDENSTENSTKEENTSEALILESENINKDITSALKAKEITSHKEETLTKAIEPTDYSIDESESTNKNKIEFEEIRISKNRCVGNTINIEAMISGSLNSNTKFTIKVENLEFSDDALNWSSNNLKLSFKPERKGNYKVEVTEGTGPQKKVYHKEVIQIDDLEQTNFTYTDLSSPFEDHTVKFEANHSIGDNFSWLIEGKEYTSQNAQFMHEFNNSGVFDVTLIESFHNGCTSTVSKPVAVNRDFDPTIEKDFTPNGDGLNDDFMPEVFQLREEAFRMVIYSGTGNVLYQTNSVHKPWNGRLNNSGEMQNPGLYIWKATLTNEEGKEIPYTGWIRIKEL